MKSLSFYEQVGIVTPGAVFLFGLMFFVPELKSVLAKTDITIGGLGVFIIISYATGHLLAALGNIIENVYWSCKRGMPSNWIVGETPRLLSPSQISKIKTLVETRFGQTIAPLAELNSKTWFPIFRQIYSDVERHGKPARGDTFNGNYGLNRGLCAATLALSVAVAIQAPAQWESSVGLLGASVVYLYRMHRFGVHYAREIYNQFLLLPSEPEKPKKEPVRRAAKASTD